MRLHPVTGKFSARRAAAQAEPRAPIPEDRHGSFAGEGWAGRVPDVAGVRDVAVHAQVVAEGVADHPFDHSFREAGSTIRVRGWVRVGLPTIRSTPAQRFRTPFVRV